MLNQCVPIEIIMSDAFFKNPRKASSGQALQATTSVPSSHHVLRHPFHHSRLLDHDEEDEGGLDVVGLDHTTTTTTGECVRRR